MLAMTLLATLLMSSLLPAKSKQDSLMAVLPSATGAQRVEILNQLPAFLMDAKPEQALQYTHSAMQLAQKLNLPREIARANHNYGHFYYVRGMSDSSLYFHRQSLALRRQLPDSVDVARSLNGIGTVYDVNGDLDSALVYYFGALDVLNEADLNQKLTHSDDLDALSTTLGNIAVCYHARDKLDLAIQYLKRGLEIDEKRNSTEDIGYDLSNIGSIYTAMTVYDSAIVYHKRALEIRRRLNNPIEISRSLHSLAHVYRQTGARDEAVQHLLEALAIKRDVGIPYEISVTLLYLGDLYNSMGRYRDAKAYATEGGLIADTLHSGALLTRYYTIIPATYAGLGDFEKAYSLNGRYQQLRDSLKKSERDALVEQLSAQYESVQKEKRISNLEAEKTISTLETTNLRSRLYFVLGGLVIVGLLGLLVLYMFMVKRKRNKILGELNQEMEERNAVIAQKNRMLDEQKILQEKQNREIKEMNVRLEKMVDDRTRNLKLANRELDLFLYQSSHALRGPLMRLMGLFSIIRDEKDPAVIAVMQEKVDYTIRAMDRMLHKLMDVTEIQRRDPQPEALSLRPILEDQLREIESDMHYPEAEINLDIPETMVLAPEKYLLSVVFRNLLENALHFRVPNRSHKVEIHVRHEAGQLHIRVTDNGIGIPKEHLDSVFSMFFRGTAESPGMGLGLYVLKKAVDLLHGKVNIQSQENEFTIVRVTLPLEAVDETVKVKEKVEI
jgi:signal transduction histidine kinase/Tfp pilus assembly protein PilF